MMALVNTIALAVLAFSLAVIAGCVAYVTWQFFRPPKPPRAEKKN